MAADASLTWDQVLAWRLAQQGLRPGRAAPTDAVALVGHLAGVQTQVETAAAQVLAVRGVEKVHLDALLWKDRALLKTWAMRGTLHLLPAAEWRTWIAVMRTREWRITPGWERYHGITKAELEAVTDAIPEALAGDPLTRDELADRVAPSPATTTWATCCDRGGRRCSSPRPTRACCARARREEGHDVHLTRGVAGGGTGRRLGRARPRRGGGDRAGPLPRRERPRDP